MMDLIKNRNDDSVVHLLADDFDWTPWSQWQPCGCRVAQITQTRNRTCDPPYTYQKGLVCTGKYQCF